MTTDRDSVETLLEYLKDSRGFDFTAYKRSSLMRRIEKRLQTIGVASHRDYTDYLDTHPDEFGLLFNTILINVTGFFRDPEAWNYLERAIVPRILEDIGPEGQIRVWSAGCASGQEAYTLAMVFAEQIGIEGCRRRVKIYASDVDEEALTQGRHAMYTAQEVQEVPSDVLGRYFERQEDRYAFRKDLRRSIIFGRHDLVQDAPISRVHLLVCRNTVMYFTRETQAKVLERFHFALRNGGFLFMGKAELLLTHGDLFTPVDLKWRVFTKVVAPSPPNALDPARREEVMVTTPKNDITALTLETDPVARVVIQSDGVLVLANDRARSMFQLGPHDIGRRLQDLDLSYRPVELRSMIREATAQRRPVSRRDLPWPTEAGESRYLEVQVVPVSDRNGEVLGAQVTFVDLTRYRRLQEELERSKNELETAYEELQSTNEELETTNEELQSTNEELETMNEELQSTNEELETINTELRLRSDELNHANAFLGSILAGLEVGVVVVDPHLQVLAWNHRAEDLWDLRADEAQGRHLMNLEIGLPVEQLLQPIRTVLAKETPRAGLALECRNRKGRTISCGVRCTPLAGGAGEVRGVIILMEELPQGSA